VGSRLPTRELEALARRAVDALSAAGIGVRQTDHEPITSIVLRVAAEMLSHRDSVTVGELRVALSHAGHGRIERRQLFNALSHLSYTGRLKRVRYGEYSLP
jgi:hypothetical protein